MNGPAQPPHSCPVCGYRGLEGPARNAQGEGMFEICDCCGTEFGYHDHARSDDELRRLWLAAGAHWHRKSRPPPPGWAPSEQLRQAGLLWLTDADADFPGPHLE